LSRIINGGKSDKHIIKPYKFRELNETDTKSDEFVSFSESVPQTPEPEVQKEQNHEVVKELLQKIEELSNTIVNSQMKFEQEIKECHQKLQQETKKAYEEGYQKGFSEAEAKCKEEIEEVKKLYEDSVKKLEEINKIFEKKLEDIEKELIAVALDIAKEVIQKELNENSKEVALSLAKSLMQDLKDASKVSIKANPEDAKYLQEKIKGIKIIPDKAVKRGGVVIISDVGNIDGEIEERFKAVKEAVKR
jgi:flagellar assembly protein FliH